MALRGRLPGGGRRKRGRRRWRQLPGGCGRVSGSPHQLAAEPHRSAARLSGKKMHNGRWIAPLGTDGQPVRGMAGSCLVCRVCVCDCGLTGGTTHPRASACPRSEHVCAAGRHCAGCGGARLSLGRIGAALTNAQRVRHGTQVSQYASNT